MGIKAVRLRPRDEKKGHKMRTYTSSFGTKFSAGEGHVPSPIRIVTNEKEVAEISKEEQFEVMEFKDMAELREKIQVEMEERVYDGGSNVRASIEGPKGKMTQRNDIASKVAPDTAPGDANETVAVSPPKARKVEDVVKPPKAKKKGGRKPKSKKE